LRAGEQIILEVTLRQTVPGAEGCQVDVWNHHPWKRPVKWWIGVLARGYVASEYVTVPKVLTVRLEFILPQGTHELGLLVNCDSYMGLEQIIGLGKIVVSS
jgi:hypothetical protein